LLLRVDEPAGLLDLRTRADDHELRLVERQLLPQEEQRPRAGARHRLELFGTQDDVRRVALERATQVTLERARDRLVELAGDDDRRGSVGDLDLALEGL